MKFTANTDTFIETIQAMLPAIDKKSALEEAKRIYITLENSEISICINTPTHYLVMPYRYRVDEDEGVGIIAFDMTTINVILKAKTFNITISTEDDNIIIRAGNRTTKVRNLTVDTESLCAPDGKFTDIMTASEMDIAEAFNNLKLFTTKDKKTPFMCRNIHINPVYNCMEALNGVAVLRRYFPQNCFTELTSAFIPVETTEHLKKALDIISDNKITISKSDDYICIKGINFTYYHRSRHIDFFDTRNLFDTMRNMNKYCIKIKELKETLVYYKDIKSKENTMEIPMMVYNNVLYTYHKCLAVETTDHIKVEPMRERTTEICKTALNGNYILDFLKVAVSIYEDEFYLYIDEQPISSTFFSAEHYDCLILPVNIKDEDVWNKLQEQIKEGK